PFQHDIDIRGIGKVGSTRHLPPVVSLQYHFANSTKATPFIGVGVNYTTFFSEKTTGALEGTRLSLDDSWGLAAHVGIDFAVNQRSAIRLDARWADIDADVKVNGVRIGTADIDPLVYGLAWVVKFCGARGARPSPRGSPRRPGSRPPPPGEPACRAQGGGHVGYHAGMS